MNRETGLIDNLDNEVDHGNVRMNELTLQEFYSAEKMDHKNRWECGMLNIEEPLRN